MIMIAKVATSFGRYSDGGLAEKAQHIINSMDGNAAYPTPVPAITDIQSLVDSYVTALANLGNTGKQGTLIKDQFRESLEELLNTLALYVQTIGGSDILVLQSSGYDLQKGKGAPVGILPKPSNFRTEPGPTPGSVKGFLDAIDGANTYLFQYAETPVNGSTVWQNVYSSKSSHIITGLTSGKEYSFRVCGIGTNPTLVFSDVITTYVL
jgi:hypothetical protein